MEALRAVSRRLAVERSQRWLLLLVIGCASGVMAYVINIGIEGLDKLRYSLALSFIHPGGGFALPWLVFNALSCAIAMVAGIGVAYLSPLAAGSGIPHIKAYCNGIDIPGLLTFKTLLVKATGAMFSIGSGLIAGKEGPFIQCGACIAALVLQLAQFFGCGGSSSSSQTDSNSSSQSDSNSSSSSISVASGCLPTAFRVKLAGRQVNKQAKSDGLHSMLSQQPATSTTSSPSNGAQIQQQQQPTNTNDSQSSREWHHYQQCRIQRELQHDQAAMGAGAGVAAAFIAPLAGAAYSIEEATSKYSDLMVVQTFLVGAVTVFFMWLFTKATSSGGSRLAALMFSSPLELAFRGDAGTDARFWWYAWELPIMLLLGVLGGLAMGAWTKLNIKLQGVRKAWLKGPIKKVADVMLCCLLTNTIRMVAAHQSPCLPIPAAADLQALEQQISSWQFFSAPTGLFPQLWCPAGHYSIYGQLFMQPLDVSVRSLFTFDPPRNGTVIYNTPGDPFSGSSAMSAQAAAAIAAVAGKEQLVFQTEVLAAYAVFVWGMLLVSYGIAAPTGIFIPCLAAGAAGGRVVAQLLRSALQSAGIYLPICMPGWSVLGAAALLTGCTRLSLANCLIVLESSGAVPMVVPMVLLMVPAKLVADALIIGIYDWQIEDAGYPFLPPEDLLSSSERAVLQHYRVLDLFPLTNKPTNKQEGLLGTDAAHIVSSCDQEAVGNGSCSQDQRKQQHPAVSVEGSMGGSSSCYSQQADQNVRGESATAVVSSTPGPAGAAGRTPSSSSSGGSSSLQSGASSSALQQLAAPSPAAPSPAAAAAAAAAAAGATEAAAAAAAGPMLMVAGHASIRTTYMTMRELGMDELPVVVLLDQDGSNSGSSSNRPQGMPAGNGQQPQHHEQQHDGQVVQAAAVVVGRLLRKDLVPAAILSKHKQQ